MRVLSGDIGGTNTRLALYEVRVGKFDKLEEETFPSRKYESLEQILREFLARQPGRAQRACFGIAGPVLGERVEVTNLPWSIDSGELAAHLEIDRVALLNDLEANAYAIAILQPEDFRLIDPGSVEAKGNMALISAGTGLGEAGLLWDGREHRPFATEGGHADFAPQDEVETALLGYLSQRYGHVSWERVLSGPGLVNLHEFLLEYRQEGSPECNVSRVGPDDRAAAVSEEAARGRCSVCAEALDLFIRLYGTEAGNLALKIKATGGLWVGGGIAPKILDQLAAGPFLSAFRSKGRMESMLSAIPVHVILNDGAALLGAARYAALFLDRE